jgi:hypothetical protein
MGTIVYRLAYTRLVARRWRDEKKHDGPLSRILSRLRSTGNLSVRLRILQNFVLKYIDSTTTVIQGHSFKVRQPRVLSCKPAGSTRKIKASPSEVKPVKTLPTVGGHFISVDSVQDRGKKRKSALVKSSAAADAPKLKSESQKGLAKPHVKWKKGVVRKIAGADAGSSSSSGVQLCNRMIRNTATEELTFKCRDQNVNYEAEVPKYYWKMAGIDTSKFDYTAYGKTKTGVHECNFMS